MLVFDSLLLDFLVLSSVESVSFDIAMTRAIVLLNPFFELRRDGQQ